MNDAILQAVRTVLDDWRREAAGSRDSAERYEQTAAEHRADQARAEQWIANIEAALREEGVES